MNWRRGLTRIWIAITIIALGIVGFSEGPRTIRAISTLLSDPDEVALTTAALREQSGLQFAEDTKIAHNPKTNKWVAFNGDKWVPVPPAFKDLSQTNKKKALALISVRIRNREIALHNFQGFIWFLTILGLFWASLYGVFWIASGFRK